MQQSSIAVPTLGQHRADINSVQILKIKQVCSLTGLSKASCYRLAADPESTFPRPVKLSSRASGWRLSELSDWLDGLQSGVRLVA
jgi:prophage regulatory protein